MQRIGTIVVEFHSWWRTTSGRADGDRIDDAIERSSDGLPWLSGRTLKGLLRDTTEQLEAWEHLAPGTATRIFGLRAEDVDPKGHMIASRYLTEPGTLRIGSAEMAAPWRDWAASVIQDGVEGREGAAIIDALFDHRAMTAVEGETGTARTASLRRVEVAAPLTLYAPVWHSAVKGEADDEATLEQAVSMVKALGAGRNRGFGRCDLRFEPSKQDATRAAP